MPSDRELVRELHGYSDVIRLGHDRHRLQELQPQLELILSSLEALEGPGVDGIVMALTYSRPQVASSAQGDPSLPSPEA